MTNNDDVAATAQREQVAILNYIRERWADHKSPTFREIGEACDMPVATVFKRVNVLIAQGKVRKGSRLSRSLEPTA